MSGDVIEVTDITDHTLATRTHRRFDIRHPRIMKELVVEVPWWASGLEAEALIRNAIHFRLRTQEEEAGVISLDRLETDPLYQDLFHRPGCSIQRSGKCICDYIGKWDPK